MKPQRKYRHRTASNNKWGFIPVLLVPNLHPNLPPRFTHFSWLFGSHGGPLAYQCVVTGNNYSQWKDCDEARIRFRELQRVETHGDPWGFSNTSETWKQKKTTSWTQVDVPYLWGIHFFCPLWHVMMRRCAGISAHPAKRLMEKQINLFYIGNP